ncbi:MAG: FUSC family protein [Aliidongia sp.]
MASEGAAQGKVRGWFDRAIPLKSEALSLAAGIRAATACALPVLIAEVTDHHELSWIAIVAFWGCLADSGGAWRTRVAAMAGFTGLATVGCLAALLAGRSIWLAVPFVLAWGFAASLARIFGNAAAVVGSLLITEVIVCLGTPSSSLTETFQRTGMTLLGGAWAMALVLVIWRLYPYGPARRAVGECWQAVAAYADALGLLHRGVAADLDWAQVTGKRRGAARDAIEAAREILAGERRRRAGESRRGALLLVLLADADQIFEALLALSEMLETTSGAGSPAAQRALRLMLHRIAQAAGQLGTCLAQGRQPSPVQLSGTLDRVKRRLAHEEPHGQAPHSTLQHAAELLERIVQYFTVAIDVARGVRQAEGLTELARRATPEPEEAPRPSAWTLIRANLGFGSLSFRHALRLGIAAAVSIWLADYFAVERGYWIGITAVVILQPFLATTWQRALERVGGSVLGGLIAAGIGLVTQAPLAVVAILFPLSVITLAVRGVNYALFVLCLTPQFVLIAELFQTGGVANWHLAGLRALDSVLGGFLGLAAGFLLWPSWEQVRLPNQLRLALQAHRDYLAAALGDASTAKIQAARRGAGLASNNAEASLQRLLNEPRRRPPAVAEAAMTMVVCLRRLAGAAAAISLAPAGARAAAEPQRAATLARAASALDSIAEAVMTGSELPALPPAPSGPERGLVESELGRIGRQIDVLHGAAARLLSRKDAAEAVSYPG